MRLKTSLSQSNTAYAVSFCLCKVEHSMFKGECVLACVLASDSESEAALCKFHTLAKVWGMQSIAKAKGNDCSLLYVRLVLNPSLGGLTLQESPPRLVVGHRTALTFRVTAIDDCKSIADVHPRSSRDLAQQTQSQLQSTCKYCITMGLEHLIGQLGL